MGSLNHKRTNLKYCILVFAICHLFSQLHVNGKAIPSVKTTKLAKHEGAVKTIKSEDGDIIDCVDIYKQPAFNHPLLKNHTLQMKPSSYDMRKMEWEATTSLVQGWHKSGECPEGTIPILRSTRITPHNTTTTSFTQSLASLPRKGYRSRSEYARVSIKRGGYSGATGVLNVWNPKTFNGEISLAQIWVQASPDELLNSLEAGWMTKSGETNTRMFIHWTADNYRTTGCYNLDCGGFVQTNNKVALGAILSPVSNYGGKQIEISITIRKDQKTRDWWLIWQGEPLGYWPQSLLLSLSYLADSISWGGEIQNLRQQRGKHTSTQMGSGHFPSEGSGKATYFRNIAHIDSSGALRDAEVDELVLDVTNTACYDLNVLTLNNIGWARTLFFGGPGFSNRCM